MNTPTKNVGKTGKTGKKNWSKKKKLTVLISLLLVMALIGTVVWWLLRPHAPDPTKLTTEKAVKYMASKEFARLSESDKEDYMRKLRSVNGDQNRELFRQNLSPDERRAVMRNTRAMMQKAMRDHMRKFFAMSKEDQMKAINEELDRRAAERASRQQSGQGRPGGQGGPGQGGGRGPGGGDRTAFMRQMLEGTDSTTRAQMAVHRQMMREAAQQRQNQHK